MYCFDMSNKDFILLNSLKATAKKVIPKGGHVWLFGSRARGEEHSGSDWDLLILIDKDKIELSDEDVFSYPFVEEGWRHSASVNPLLYSYSEWQIRSVTPFYKNVEREKVLLA